MNNCSAYINQMKFTKSFIYNLNASLCNGDISKNSNSCFDIDDLIFFDEEWYLSEK